MKRFILLLLLVVSIVGMTSCKKGKESVLIGTINQTELNAPTFEESENKVAKITWKRNAKGIYQGDFDKPLKGKFYSDALSSSDVNTVIKTHITSDYIQVFTTRDGEFEDGLLVNIGIEIRVYN